MKITPEFNEETGWPLTRYDYLLDIMWDIIKLVVIFFFVIFIGGTVLTQILVEYTNKLPEMCKTFMVESVNFKI